VIIIICDVSFQVFTVSVDHLLVFFWIFAACSGWMFWHLGQKYVPSRHQTFCHYEVQRLKRTAV